MFERRIFRNLDFLFLLFFGLLLGASLLILSTASLNVDPGHPYHYVKLQAVWIMTGLVLVAAIAAFDYEKIRRFTWSLYGINLVLLAAVFLVGSSAKGATRWIPITSTVSIQPSEFAKLFIIITLADFLAKRQGKLNRFRDFLAPFLFVLVPLVLVYKQPDLGTSMVFVAIFIVMMFVAGANPWKFGSLVLGTVLVVSLALWLHFAHGLPLPLQDYQLQRLIIFANPSADTTGGGYHVTQSIWAIGSGGLWGKGYRQGTQGRFNFLPEHHTDFIFSIVGEEFGFIGAVTLLFIYLIFILRAVGIAAKSRDLYGMLLSTGVVAMFVFHILINVGMTSGIMPVTGIPLPLISYGGSTMWANMTAAGLLLSVNLRRQKLMF
ncbi:Rod shape-determining protein RodA [Peptococcaceae bacterium CEB3]|nr:Rod shape-determining protein RodA [Peptococcaceae bacterium CEB3]